MSSLGCNFFLINQKKFPGMFQLIMQWRTSYKQPYLFLFKILCVCVCVLHFCHK